MSNEKRISGWAWHAYHNRLVAWTYYDARIRTITERKPKHEQKVRLQLFKMLRGRIPQYIEDSGGQVCLMSSNDKEKFMKKHERECPNCPWNGKTIFPKSKKKN